MIHAKHGAEELHPPNCDVVVLVFVIIEVVGLLMPECSM